MLQDRAAYGLVASQRSPRDREKGDRQTHGSDRHESIQGDAGGCRRRQDGCQAIREVLKETPAPNHCNKLIRETGVLLRFQDWQCRQLRNSVEAPTRQVYLQGTATPGQTHNSIQKQGNSQLIMEQQLSPDCYWL